ncbi:hypothetical protein EDC30_107178 [Paucimonas lemoignei]|uniref:Uncharacterized protein n=1 Tax=Paucimonas lemoignei TaxID=29443 RepID=A0A4R3HVV3_PAULE|nr:hypothetical protein [Paucimonas lemoignei]TCS36361.1 hypothetical protein EDC30_107178 [Paucimonas lemoignei]
MTSQQTYRTPDDRYIVVRGRLWRASNPHLPEAEREALTRDLMAARREVRSAMLAQDSERLAKARAAVNAAKIGLGERGPVWWDDGAKDYNRHLVKNTPYAKWYEQVSEE